MLHGSLIECTLQDTPTELPPADLSVLDFLNAGMPPAVSFTVTVSRLIFFPCYNMVLKLSDTHYGILRVLYMWNKCTLSLYHGVR